MRYLAALMANPHEDLSVVQLVNSVNGIDAVSAEGKVISRMSAEELEHHGLTVGEVDRPVEVLDAIAIEAYKMRIADLERQQAAVTDPADHAEIAEQLETLRESFARDIGKANTARTFPHVVEKMRKAVSNGIARAIDKINASLPSLGMHLINAVRTGTCCSYRPDKDMHWQL